MTPRHRSVVRDQSRPAFTWTSIAVTFALAILATLSSLASIRVESLWFTTFLPPIFLTVAALRAKGPAWRHALVTWIASMPLWAIVMLWISNVTKQGFPPLFMYLALYAAFFVATLAWFARRYPSLLLLLIPVLWTALEYIRGEIVFHGFAWYHTAHPLIGTGLDLPARLGGQYLVSLLAVSVCASLVLLSLRPRKARSGIALACISALWTALAFAPARQGPGSEDRSIKVAAVQTNVPQSVRGAWSRESQIQTLILLEESSRAAAEQGASLIVWPETMFPGWILDTDSTSAVLQSSIDQQQKAAVLAEARWAVLLHKEISVPIVVGAASHKAPRIDQSTEEIFLTEGRFNSSIALDRGFVQESRYDKVRLAPFGEEIPYASAWPWLEQQLLNFGASGMSFDLSKGSTTEPLTIQDAGVRIATPICFESAVSAHCRDLVNPSSGARADLLTNQTNDGWFARHDAVRRDHLLLARWRCLELGVPMIRAANTGITAAIDDRGRIVGELPPREPGLLVTTLELGAPLTAYAVTGDIVGPLMLLLAFGFVVAAFLRRSQPVQADGPDTRSSEPESQSAPESDTQDEQKT